MTMNKLPEIVLNAWNNRKGPSVFSTVNKNGTPNSIYVNSISLFDENQIIVANNFFCKTLENIFSGSTGAILFITNDDMSYQIKGGVSYFTEGEQFDDMKKWNPEKHPGHGAAALTVEEAFSGSKKLL